MELIRSQTGRAARASATLALALFAFAQAAHAGDYVLDIDGKKVELDLDRPQSASMDGKTVTLLLKQKSERTWQSDGMSFTYPAAFSPTRHAINDKVTQILMATSSGSLVIVQHYIGTNPSQIIDLMISKLTDEEVSAGYTRSEKPSSRKLIDGSVLSGKVVHTEHPGESWDREVVAIGDRDGGYVMVGALNDDSPQTDRAMLDLFWRSLKLNAAQK